MYFTFCASNGTSYFSIEETDILNVWVNIIFISIVIEKICHINMFTFPHWIRQYSCTRLLDLAGKVKNSSAWYNALVKQQYLYDFILSKVIRLIFFNVHIDRITDNSNDHEMRIFRFLCSSAAFYSMLFTSSSFLFWRAICIYWCTSTFFLMYKLYLDF